MHFFRRAILHVDADSFFASCETVRDPSLRGKAVVTGRERGIATSMSLEAKKRGVTRGMTLSEIRRTCPEAVIVGSDYEMYALYSRRMYEIVRRYTPEVEEYSIDECFADLTGLRRSLRLSYPEMARHIKQDLDSELGMTFSVGLSINKISAKLASKWGKPSGCTVIPGCDLPAYLAKTPIEKIWGIGPNTSAHLRNLGILTARDLAEKSEAFVVANLNKPYRDIWQELRGESVLPLATGPRESPQSISRTRTFTPASSDREFIYSQLSQNVENACIKLRRCMLYASEASFFLKTSEFRYHALELKFSQATSLPHEVLRVIREQFDLVYRPGTKYRATGITLLKLSGEEPRTLDLFGAGLRAEGARKVYREVDRLAERFGSHAVFLGSSLSAMKDAGLRRKSLGIPSLGKVK